MPFSYPPVITFSLITTTKSVPIEVIWENIISSYSYYNYYNYYSYYTYYTYYSYYTYYT